MMSGLPPITCGDGTRLSIQGGEDNYSTPRTDNAYYSEVEVMFLDGARPPESWEGYYDGHSTAEYVPVKMVREYIETHGGLASGDLPQGVYANDCTHNQVSLTINGNYMSLDAADLENIKEAFNTWFAAAHAGRWCRDPDKSGATSTANRIDKAIGMLLRNEDGSTRPCR